MAFNSSRVLIVQNHQEGHYELVANLCSGNTRMERELGVEVEVKENDVEHRSSRAEPTVTIAWECWPQQ